VVVADRGMLSEKNTDHILDAGYHYIIGERPKQLPKALRAGLIDTSKHKTVSSVDTENIFTYTTATHKGRKVICTYSSKIANKDAHEREKLIEKA